MATTVLTETPDIAFTSIDARATSVLKYAGRGREQRATLEPIGRRRYGLPFKRTASEMATFNAFFLARGGIVEPFYFQDPKDSFQTAIDLGTSIASQTEFFLPTTGEDQRWYPIDNASLVVKDDGVPVSVASVDTDARSVTLSAVPTVGSVMTLDCNAYRLVRLVAPFEWRGLAPDFFATELELIEVPA